MRNDDREVLTTVAKLNSDMGAIVLSLLNGARDSGSLPPDRLRDLAAICDDMCALLGNHADKLEGQDRIVIDGDVSPQRPVDGSRQTADDGVMVHDWTSREIRALRLARRMTLEEFAAHLGVSARMVCRWERVDAPSRPRLVHQAVLDTSLRMTDADTRERYAHLVAKRWRDSLTEGDRQ